jgi:aminoglycoside phosphotransferase family enzyme/predicted kinase
MTPPNLIDAMSDAGFYPQRPSSVEVRQTHISCVFLAGDFVYKLKKALRFSFLDYSTLEQRYRFCQEEVALNRRLTPRVYLGVFAIMRRGEGFALAPNPAQRFDPEAVEYAVMMRRLPDERSLERLVRTGGIDPAGMRRIAFVLAKFHAGAARDRSMEYGSAEAIGHSIVANLEECRPFVGDTIGEREFNSISRFNRTFIENHRKFLDGRARDGMVREGHGDLRSEHICVQEEIDVIDCVEFSQRLRYADIASDLAFLLMDLDRLQAPALGHHLLRAYLDEIGDSGLVRLLNFYKCYRATVRGLVGSLKARQSEVPSTQRSRARESARDYFAAAYRYAKAGSPTLVAICGLPASGKSTVAQALAERSGFAVFNSDVIRKRLAGKNPTERAGSVFGEDIYSVDFTAATYKALAEAAAQELRAGNGVILDATYKDDAERMRLRDLAGEVSVPIVFAQCAVTDEQARQRLAARALASDAVSDATWVIYVQHKAAFKPFGPEFARCHLRVDGAADAADSACEVERFIASHY